MVPAGVTIAALSVLLRDCRRDAAGLAIPFEPRLPGFTSHVFGDGGSRASQRWEGQSSIGRSTNGGDPGPGGFCSDRPDAGERVHGRIHGAGYAVPVRAVWDGFCLLPRAAGSALRGGRET